MLNNEHHSEIPLRFDRIFMRELIKVLLKYFSSQKLASFTLLFLIILCTVITVRSTVALNQFNQNFFNALQAFNIASIRHLIISFVPVIIIFSLAMAYNSYFSGLLGIKWRNIATNKYIDRWLTQQRYHHLELAKNTLDNTDQRIANDLDQFPEITLVLFSLLLNSVLTLISFGVTLCHASVPIKIGLNEYKIPGFFCICAFTYAIVGTLLTKIIGKRLANLYYSQEKKSADFRFSLIKIREASQEIAFFKGEQVERVRLNDFFTKVIANAFSINMLKKRLTFFSNTYTMMGMTLGIILATPFYLNKQIDMGTLMLISGAFTYTINAFSIFVSIFQSLASWRAALNRIAQLDSQLDENHQLQSNIRITLHKENFIKVLDLHLFTPLGKQLLSEINMTFLPGGRYLIKGHTGIGKSTFFKAVSGLWPYGEGTIYLPEDTTTLFLPQKPYLFHGSLSANLIYPGMRFSEETKLREILSRIGLSELEHRLYSEEDWSKTLSLGQQQLISFARILLLKPNIIFLDEATSALDENTESDIYTSLREELPNSIVLSIGHRNSLEKFHEVIILADQTFKNISGSFCKQCEVPEMCLPV